MSASSCVKVIQGGDPIRLGLNKERARRAEVFRPAINPAEIELIPRGIYTALARSSEIGQRSSESSLSPLETSVSRDAEKCSPREETRSRKRLALPADEKVN